LTKVFDFGACQLGIRCKSRHSEFNAAFTARAFVDLGEFLLCAGETDLESFDLAEPSFAFGFSGVFQSVV
jgi:hypothetical protein